MRQVLEWGWSIGFNFLITYTTVDAKILPTIVGIKPGIIADRAMMLVMINVES